MKYKQFTYLVTVMHKQYYHHLSSLHIDVSSMVTERNPYTLDVDT